MTAEAVTALTVISHAKYNGPSRHTSRPGRYDRPTTAAAAMTHAAATLNGRSSCHTQLASHTRRPNSARYGATTKTSPVNAQANSPAVLCIAGLSGAHAALPAATLS